MRQHRYVEAQDAYRTAVKIGPPYPPAYGGLAACYGRRNEFKEQTLLLEEIARSHLPVDLPALLSNILTDRESVSQRNRTELLLRGLFDDQGIELNYFISPSAATAGNYRGIRDLARREGALFVSMQYPTLDLASLNKILGTDAGTFFVGNKDNFRRALSEGRYEDYFRDRFRGTWGHCTGRGNALIAQNLADALLKDIPALNPSHSKTNPDE